MSDRFGLIVIGDEILNGRRRDRHFDAIGSLLRERGFGLAWMRILADDPDHLVAELTRTMGENIPVICCGGIGATPDDHTRACAARAAGVPLTRHPEAVEMIERRFGEAAYPNRIRMAELPQDCDLIPNPQSRIPGFSVAQHYFVPGFPDMALSMATWVLETRFTGGCVAERQRAVRVYDIPESELMDLMESLVERFANAKLFSLPRQGEKYQIDIGFRGRSDLDAPMDGLIEGLQARGARFEHIDD